MTPEHGATVLSFRHLLTAALEEFLEAQQMSSPFMVDALGELVVSLSRYREEGAALYPLVFVCDDLEPLLRLVDGCDPIPLGDGPAHADTIRRALKTGAPLGQAGWSVYVERHDERLRFGLFRTDNFVLCETPLEILRRANDPSLRVIGVVQLADSIVELRGSAGTSQYIYLSGARTDGPPPIAAAKEFLRAVVRDVPEAERTDTLTFYRRVMLDVLRAPHGTLAVVLPKETDPRDVFSDGLFLAEPIDIVSKIRAYRREHGEAARASIHAAGMVVQSMMASDGITVMRSDGAIVGFNVFASQGEKRTAPAIGGARRRTFDALASRVGSGLDAAFYRSQDGQADARRI